MRPATSPEARNRVLELRRTHSISDVAKLTGLPVGTVKTILSRSGTRRDNEALRRLTTLPEPREGASRSLAVPEVPELNEVTGNFEIDAVLHLRKCISLGDPALIAKSLEAVRRIKTPLTELGKTYRDWLLRNHPGGALAAAFGSFGFADLDGLAKGALERAQRKADALARFGSEDELLSATPAEQFCLDTLHGLEREDGEFCIDPDKAGARFREHPELLPHTLADCLWELVYWRRLYLLRCVFEGSGDGLDEVNARQDFLFSELATIRPRSREEAVAVLRFLAEEDAMDRAGVDSILHNLIR
jgi:hypothetical protein